MTPCSCHPVPSWNASQIPDQSDRLAVITGATGGLGYETALELARAGAEVILTGRSQTKGLGAVNRILAVCPGAKVSFEPLDLASLASVGAFVQRFSAAHASLDLLINNAGVMALPGRGTELLVQREGILAAQVVRMMNADQPQIGGERGADVGQLLEPAAFSRAGRLR